jgi:protein involved in polysaccharide export with SLBB domain
MFWSYGPRCTPVEEYECSQHETQVRANASRGPPRILLPRAYRRLPDAAANGSIPQVKRTLTLLLSLALGAQAANAQQAPLRAGDKVVVRILRDSLFVATYIVDERGMITLPLAGDLRVTTTEGSQVRDSVRARLAPYLNDSRQVEVVALRKVRVIGAAKLPGVQYVALGATVRDAVAMANGVGTDGGSNRVILVRGTEQRALDNWATAATGTTILESGDDIVVSQLSWFARNTAAAVTGVGILLSVIVTLARR